MVLVYPPYWEITFWKGVSDEDGEPDLVTNDYMPRLKLCNLTGLNTTFNSSGNFFHKGGAPIEVDISLSFTESMALTREDLYNVNNDKPMYDDVSYVGANAHETARAGVFQALSLSGEAGD